MSPTIEPSIHIYLLVSTVELPEHTMSAEALTMTLSEKQKKPKELLPENERYLRCCSDIASFLVQEHEALQDPSKPKKDVNLVSYS